MKFPPFHNLRQGAALALLLATLSPQLSTAFSPSTAFTYQGRLNAGANPASGIYDLQFTIYDSAGNPGGLVAGPLTNSATGVSNGLFTVTLDFGVKVFTGEDRWLEIAVRTNGVGTFTNLSPRQLITPAPYAITAANLASALPFDQLEGTLQSGQLSGVYSSAVTFNSAGNSFTGNGSGLSNLNASRLTSGTVPDARLSTNVALLNASATFLGTVEAQGDLKGLRLNVGTDHVLSGTVSSITGGDENVNGGPYSTIAGGQINVIQPAQGWSFIGAGFNNHIGTDAYACVIGAGEENNIADGIFFGTIAGGVVNSIGAGSPSCAIGGGDHNTIGTNSIWSTIAGGRHNTVGANSDRSTVGGGEDNNIARGSFYTTIAGGVANDIGTNAYGSVVSGGEDNNIGNNALHSVIGGGLTGNIGTGSDSSTVGGGLGNSIGNNSAYATIGGGANNTVSTNSYYSTIGGGQANSIDGNSLFSTIAGGHANAIVANASFGTVPGGTGNLASSQAFAAGSNARATNSGAFVWSDSTGTITGSTNNNSVTMRASGGYRFFTGTNAAGAQLPPGATAWSVLSDRNMKKDIRPADCRAILDQLSRVPISRWHYTWEDASDPLDLGPMAQDFKAAFYPGRDDKTISTLEFDGVALAAIQGLNEKVEMKTEEAEDRIRKLETENAGLKQRLDALEKIIRNQKSN